MTRNESVCENSFERYHNFCLRCIDDDRSFVSFKSSDEYRRILEHVDPATGAEYLDVIRKHENIFNQIAIFKRNDLIGETITCDYSSVGSFSPTTLRYAKVACDLDKFMGDLSGLKICEIGGGYGGQFLILDSLYGNLDYSIVDLRGALLLAKKYLSHHRLASNVTYLEPEDVRPEQYDLVISNYAFSELPRDIQDFYAENILRSSKNGYITYNDYPNNFSLEDYSTKFRATIIDEFPLTCATNKIIFWGGSANNAWYEYGGARDNKVPRGIRQLWAIAERLCRTRSEKPRQRSA